MSRLRLQAPATNMPRYLLGLRVIFPELLVGHSVHCCAERKPANLIGGIACILDKPGSQRVSGRWQDEWRMAGQDGAPTGTIDLVFGLHGILLNNAG